MTIRRVTFGLLAGAAALPAMAPAQDAYPERPIELLIGFNPGGAVDTTARLLIENLEAELGVPIVAVQRPGGGGTVMATSLLGEEPDGYTIGMGASAAYALAPQLNPDLSYDIDGFAHIATVSIPQDALVVSADSPWTSYEDMVAAGQEGPISLSSQVSVSRLMAIAIADATGIEIQVVPVQGGSAGIQQVLGGQTDMTWGASGWHQQVEAGEMKPLLSLGYERNADFPDVPTLQELGIDYAFVDTFMLSAPPGTPDAIVERLTEAVKAALTPELQAELKDKMYLSADYRGPEETVAYLHMQHDQIQPFVERMLAEGDAPAE